MAEKDLGYRRVQCTGRGSYIISLPKEENMRWAAAVRAILDGYVKNMKEKGLPGDKALKFYMDELKKLQ